MKKDTYQNLDQLAMPTSTFASSLLRDSVLTSLLKDDTNAILYWAGKDLAREFHLEALSSIQDFFQKAGWGTLEMKSQKHSQQIWQMSGELVQARFAGADEPDFSLETGFLAQQLEQQMNTVSEGRYDVQTGIVNFTILTDPTKASGEHNKATEQFRDLAIDGD